MKGLFDRSARDKQKLIIFYIDSNNKITQRYIQVLQVHEDYIIAYCYYRKKLRTFKFDNILSAGPMKVGA